MSDDRLCAVCEAAAEGIKDPHADAIKANTAWTRTRLAAHVAEQRAELADIVQAIKAGHICDAPRARWLIAHLEYDLDVLEALIAEESA